METLKFYKTKSEKLTLNNLVEQLQNDNASKYDIVIPAKNISCRNGQLIIGKTNNDKMPKEMADLLRQSGITNSEDEISLEISQTTHENLADKLSINRNYYNKINTKQTKDIFDFTLNYWLQNHNENVLCRTFVDREEKQGVIRAMLSDRYKVLDNYDMLLATLQAVRESGVKLVIQDCSLTDKRMYVRFTCPDVEIESKELLKNYKVPNKNGGFDSAVGYGIISGFVLSNSEVGQGTYSISPRAVVLACSNGMILSNEKYRKTHLGERQDISAVEWSEQTKSKNIDLIISQIKDIIKTYVSEDYFSKEIRRIEQLGRVELKHANDACRNVCKDLLFPASMETDILNFFTKSCDHTPFGITQAMTYYAHSKADADTQYQLEEQAIGILENISSYDKPYIESKKSQRTKVRMN